MKRKRLYIDIMAREESVRMSIVGVGVYEYRSPDTHVFFVRWVLCPLSMGILLKPEVIGFRH